MRKILILMIAALMVLSLAACSGNTKESPETQTAAQEIANQPNFDTSWAGEGQVMPVPKPPADNFNVEQNENNVMIKCMDAEEIGALSIDDVIAYCDELKKAGYDTVKIEREVEKEEGYEFEATNKENTSAYLAYSGKNDYILIVVEW